MISRERTLLALASAAGAALAFSVLLMPVMNPDVYWHLSAGKYILSNWAIPSTDFLSWTEYGAPWTDFEWLPQAAYQFLYSRLGMTGLFLLKLAALAPTLLIFRKFLALYSLEAEAFWTLPLWGLALLPNADLRPENFSVLFFTAELYLLEKMRVKGAAGVRPGVLYGAAAAFFALWANLHAGFLYGLLLIVFYAAGEAAQARLPGTPASPEGTVRIKLLLTALAVCALAALANPFGYKIYSVMLSHYRDLGELQSRIIEWAPSSFTNPFQWPFAFFLAAAFGSMLALFLKEKKIVVAHLFAAGYFGLAASSHTRHIVFFSAAGLVFSLCALAAWPGAKESEEVRYGRLVLTAAVFLFLASQVWPRYYRMPLDFGRQSQGAAGFLKDNPDRLSGLKLYNPWNWGGYLGFALSPGYRVFLDGRYLFHKYLPETDAAAKSFDDWNAFFARRDFELAVLQRDPNKLEFKLSLGGGKEVALLRPAYLVYMHKTRWALLWWDEYSMIFVRRDKADTAWLKGHEFQSLRPGDMENAGLMLCTGQLRREDIAAEEKKLKEMRPYSLKEELDFGRFMDEYPASCRNPGN